MIRPNPKSVEKLNIPLSFIKQKQKQLNLTPLIQITKESKKPFKKTSIDPIQKPYEFPNLQKSHQTVQQSFKNNQNPLSIQLVSLQNQQEQDNQNIQAKKSLAPKNKKQLNRIRSIIRKQSLLQTQILQDIASKQRRREQRIKRKIILGDSNKNLNQIAQDLLIQLQPAKQSTKKTQVVYVDSRNIRKGAINNPQMQSGQCLEIPQSFSSIKNGTNLIGFNGCYKNSELMYQMNKCLHDRDTYRFNVRWWEDDLKKPGSLKDMDVSIHNYNQTLNPTKRSLRRYQKIGDIPEQERRNLKRILKPLRRHKLIGSKYAPLKQFMTNGVFESTNYEGRQYQTSSSQDDCQLDVYDKIGQGQAINNDKLIDLRQNQQQANNKKQIKRQKKKIKQVNWFETDRKSNRKKKSLNETDKNPQEPIYSFQKDDQMRIQNKLKRALNKMRRQNWEQDRLYTRGDEQRPIQIDKIN